MKRALLFCAPFFDYHNDIRRELEAAGYAVDYHDDRPSTNPFVKGMIKLRPSAIKSMASRYFDSIIRKARDIHYDLVLVINGKTMTHEVVERLRQDHPGALFVLYLWDAVQLYPTIVDFSDLFDRRFSFDAADVANLDGKLSLRPLFYNHAYEAVGQSPPAITQYDLMSVCTAHPNRYQLMRTLFPRLEAAGLRVFDYKYLHPLQFAFNVAREPSFRWARPSEFHFRPLPTSEYVDTLRQSAAVFDINHTAQTGLTMRTIETIGARRKLITTNASVKEYHFFDPTRILTVDTVAPDVDSIIEFLATPQTPLSTDEYDKLSIRNWVGELIAEGDHGAIQFG